VYIQGEEMVNSVLKGEGRDETCQCSMMLGTNTIVTIGTEEINTKFCTECRSFFASNEYDYKRKRLFSYSPRYSPHHSHKDET
jgi:hypothetical protein